MTERLYVLGEVVGRPAVFAFVAFVLFLLGDTVKVSAQQIAKFVYTLQPSVRLSLLTRESYHALHLYAGRLQDNGDDRFDLMKLMSGIMQEFPEIRMRLIANHMDVYLEHDRLDSEGELRVNLAVYSVTLWFILAALWTPWLLLGLVVSAVFFRNGTRALQEGNAILVQALASGIVESQRFTEEKDRQESRYQAI
ncbi:hypothetical protein ACIQU3_07480 [Streptomyces sp. NPDC101110]|uniref:hypothetical protein n=1 Tax=Streptomyces sp. NPDC101110 TaxID=3366104 RepID=UPI003820768C